MIQLPFSENFNGKLFNDFFSDVRLHDEIFYEGNYMEVMLKGMNMGMVKVITVRTFPYNKISDLVSYINVGKHAAYLADMLRRFNHGSIENDEKLSHIVFQYTNRNMETQTELLQDWWRSKDKRA